MKKLLLLCVFAGAIQMYALAVPTGCKDPAGCNPELSCEGDGRFRSSCNWCRCVGGRSLCTKRGCPPGLAERLEGEPECEGNVTFHRECNTCSCVNGRAVCTTKYCGGPSGPPSEISVTVTEERDQRSPTDTEPDCTPGSRWKVDCNWCTCNELGLGICTKKGCPPVPTEQQKNEPDCEGASRWRKDCNWCSCVDGRGLCTLKACEVDKVLLPPSDTSVSDPSEIPKPPEREIMCTNGSRYRDECNWCSCTELGIPICTMMGCPPEIMEHFKNEPECIGDSSWMRDCNWCNCLNGNAVCTLKECSPRVYESSVIKRDDSEEEPLCIKGSVWREHCNWCSCSETGNPGCTEKGCLMPPEDIKEPECRGNARWKRDCNWCGCEEGRAVCTEKACLGSASDTCVEGAVWHVGCNSCICQNGRSLCTEKDCRPDGSTSQCLPNTNWKDDCNTCFCGEGQPVCTKMLCTSPSHCYLPPIELDGPLCEGFQRKWTFDSAARQCKSIVYGGCGGTANLFDSEFDCLTSCLFPLGEGSLKKGSGGKNLGQQDREDVAKSQKRCLLPMDEGPCFGALPYFFYNKVTGKCERFTYGGCRGNANRFFSLEECQETCAGIAPATDETCDRSKCPWKRWGHYLAKGCLPQYDGGACCPTRFLCSSYDESQGNKTQCFYRNRAYDIGERLEVADDCSAGCLCAESYSAEAPEILCASVECPDLFHPHPPGCRPLYRLGQCCAYDYDCADSQSPTGLETRAQTCFWNNRTYHEGDQMYFDRYPCQRCICSSDFTDPFGPGCIKIDCGFEFRYTNRYDRGCVPIFFKENCCPIDWLCPGDSRIAELEDDIMEDEDRRSDQCHLGSISLEVGKSLQLSNCEIDCRCITPPEFTCTMLDNCEAVTEKQSYRDCPEITCNAECTPLTDTLSGCLTCSCKNQSFTCPELQCSPSCGTSISYETGCPECSCQCPVASGQTPCPDTCTVVRDSNGCPVSCECNFEGFGFSSFDNCTKDPHCPENCTVNSETGCGKCECNSSHNGNSTKMTRRQVQCSQNPPCPQDCAVIRQLDQNTGCLVCICDPRNPGNPFISPPLRPPRRPRRCPTGRPPCPQDCAVRYVINRNTGCLACTCINNSGNPFTPVTRQCPLGPDGRPPCPQDCSVIQTVDQNTGCLTCICDPNSTGNPFVPVNPQPPNPFQTCPTGPDGKPPCPQDCGVIQTVDQNTGCKVCICDPNDTGNPFGPLNPPPPPTRSCPTNPDGKPPCPQDCGVIQTVDKITGCAICICDPNDTGNPFGPLNPPPPPTPPPTRSCPTNPDGKPPCPQDCGVIQTVDKNTGCAICICDPNDTGNPFGPFNPPPPPPPPSSGY